MDLNECLKKGFLKRTATNKALINSLLSLSDVKEKTVKKAIIDEENIPVYVSVAYDSLREILEAISISKGYKVLSHICIGELMKKLFPPFDHSSFDRFRWIRNGINYYGRKIGFEQGKEIIKLIFELKKESLRLLPK
jgi:hypothetical protein